MTSMKNVLFITLLLVGTLGWSQDSTNTYKKRVLETTEVDFLMSYYAQDGNNAAVTGGVGTEELTDLTPTIVVAMPLNADEVLTVDAGISAYTSASSSNLDPFDGSGNFTGSPWVASSGASSSDVWGSVTISYDHSSDDRNTLWGAHANVATEFDYSSLGFGGSFAKLFNEKNTEIGIKAQVYLDQWRPRYPIELRSYVDSNGDLSQGFFRNVTFWREDGSPVLPGDSDQWSPLPGFELINDKGRNSFSASLSFSQILSKNAQISLFMDIVQQQGWLANPMQRVYFKDRANYYVGNPADIPNYTESSNTEVFHIADDIERLPDTRFKTPIGLRFNYYINEILTVRTYYRYYFDDWGMSSHTANIEVPVKITDKFTLYPSYRYYTQTAIDYFAPYDEHLSTDEFYTSDYDLSEYDANQYGFGISYTDIFTKFHLYKFGLKSIDLRYQHYNRSTGLNANIISGGFKFVMD